MTTLKGIDLNPSNDGAPQRDTPPQTLVSELAWERFTEGRSESQDPLTTQRDGPPQTLVRDGAAGNLAGDLPRSRDPNAPPQTLASERAWENVTADRNSSAPRLNEFIEGGLQQPGQSAGHESEPARPLDRGR